MKRRQKPGFLRPISSKITPTKEKERTKSKSEEGERRRREKNNGSTLSFYNRCSGDNFWAEKKKLLDGRGLFGDNVFKNLARYILKS